MIILFILGIIDLVAGIMLLLSLAGVGFLSGLIVPLAVILIIKALYSLAFRSFFGGATDLISAGLLLSILYKLPIPPVLILIIAILLVVKSAQSLIFALLK